MCQVMEYGWSENGTVLEADTEGYMEEQLAMRLES